jgi:hypothetical protein
MSSNFILNSHYLLMHPETLAQHHPKAGQGSDYGCPKQVSPEAGSSPARPFGFNDGIEL